MKFIFNYINVQLLYLLLICLLLFPSEYHLTDNTSVKTAIFDSMTTYSNKSSDYFSKINLNNITRQNRLERLLQGPKVYSNMPAGDSMPHVYNTIQSQRFRVLEDFLHNDQKTQQTFSKQYSINNTTKKYLSFHHLDIDSFQSCDGNLLQHIIHKEFILLTDATAHLWNQRITPEVKNLTTIIADFTSAGTSFNHIGEVKKAIVLADLSWAILDCILAAGEGVMEGITSVIYDIRHPIETTQNYASAIITCGKYLYTALQEIDSLTEDLIRGNFDTAHNTYFLWSQYFKHISYTLSEHSKELTTRDIIKNITSTVVQCYATTRALNGFSSLFDNAHQGALSFAKKISEGIQESNLLMSAEGIPLRVSRQVLQQAKKSSRAQGHLAQALSKFKGKKIKVGKIACLLDKKGLKHILERHHPQYWNGSLAKTQTFFHKDTTISDIVYGIKEVIKQNREILIEKGTNNMYQIDGMIRNVKYRVGFDYGRIGQFYIPFKQ
jgi:hypothetical protein